jgi:hypothetical protein
MAQRAYNVIASYPANLEAAREALDIARDAVGHALSAGGKEGRVAFDRDVEKLASTHLGDISSAGGPLDIGSGGPLGPLWLFGWQNSRQYQRSSVRFQR